MSRDPFAADRAVPARLAAQDGGSARALAAAALADGVLPGPEAARIAPIAAGAGPAAALPTHAEGP